MEAQTVVVIQDASREINLRVFEWALDGLSLMPGDMLTLIAVLHEVITPMGYKSSVDSRLMFGANQKIIEALAARMKEEYLKNAGLAQIFKLYKTKKVGFKIETAMGSSLKAVALKSAMKLKATWLILDRKMKNDEEYFLQKLSCGILRIRRFNRIVRLRGPLNLPQETRLGSTQETYADSILIPDTSTEPDPDPFSIESSPYSNMPLFHCMILLSKIIASDAADNPVIGQVRYYGVNHEEKSLHDEMGCSTPDHQRKCEKGISNKQLVCQMKRDQQWQDQEQPENRHQEKEKNQELKQKFEEKNGDITCGGCNRETEKESSNTKVYQKSERCPSFAGARSFYLEGAEEYRVCEHFFSLSNFHLRN
ncbi:hypothetical protein RJT34_11132 [Clitoria ternatea]|uniref:Uncharacterized protein n=1 Tax=Clitoria ternatea TaxID=43366 RepID=A0AAN9PI60_CLITE